MSKTIRKITHRNAEHARDTLANPNKHENQGRRERDERKARLTLAGISQIPRRTCMSAHVDATGAYKLNTYDDTNSRKARSPLVKRQARIAGRAQIRRALQEL